MTNRPPRPRLALAAAACLALGACDGGTTDPAAEADEPIAVDAALEARHARIMAVHDEVMPERARLVRLQRDLKAGGLEGPGDRQALARLSAADDAMMAWMYAEVPLTQLADSLERPALDAHLDEREAAIRAVADSMRASMAFAEETLAR